MILFGHPTGNPNSHHAALAHYEAGRLAAFCVPWMPSAASLNLLQALPSLRRMAGRLSRRRFAPLENAPLIQGRAGEWRRLFIRALGRGDEGLAYEANDWLMDTMATACQRREVTAVHTYEDCSLRQFEAAKRAGKACLYDLPIGYHPAWKIAQAGLLRDYADWLPAGGLSSSRWVRPEQKIAEMKLADCVLIACDFVRQTMAPYVSKKTVLAPYGVDSDFWCPGAERPRSGPLRFIYAGQIGLRKGIPLLLQAWQAAALPDAELELAGTWQLAERKRAELPASVTCRPPCSREELRERYRAADVFVFPSFFEGFGLVLLEAMACGLPAIASTATAGPDVLDEHSGRVIKAGDLDQLVESLRWFAAHRDQLPAMSRAARTRAQHHTWERYRKQVTAAVADFV